MKNLSLFLLVVAGSSALAASGGGHGDDHSIPVKLIIIQAVNFTVFFGLLAYFLKKPLKTMFADRKKNFTELVNKAEAARAEAEVAKRQISEKLSHLTATAQQSISQAQVEAAEMKKRIIEEAQALAERLRVEAKRSADVEIERAKLQLRQELLQSAQQHAEKQLREKVGDPEQKRLQSEFVEKIQVAR